ncbi:MAG: PbsX family transcriptional regulator [Rhodoferax sp.]
METVIRKWGNSPALRLPSSVLKQAGYQLEQKVELVVSRNRIVIRPADKLEYDLQALVDGITPENRHEAVDFGPARGKEAP